MIFLQTHSCPTCKKKIKGFPEVVPEINPIDKNIKINKKIWSGQIRKNIFFPYFRCQCGILTSKIFVSRKSLSYLYSGMNDNIQKNDNPINDIKTKKNYLFQIQKVLLKKKINILEIGADNGNFVKLIKEFNNSANVTIIEPNKKMHKKLKMLTKNVFNDIQEIPKKKKFDLIIAIHVLDHIPNISYYLEKIRKMLNKNGYIYGVVHNEKSLLAKILRNKWPPYSLQHPHLFNKNTINFLFKNLKFKKDFIKKTTNYFNLGFLLQSFFLILFKKQINIPSFFSIGLKLGNLSFLYTKN